MQTWGPHSLLIDNLSTGTFLEGLASNWQAAFLQLASLIVFSSFLYQRGAPHSRDLRKAKSEQKRREEADRFTWLYRNSLFLAFVLLFVLSLALHVVFGTNAYNEERALIGEPPISIAAFLLLAKFWSSTLQTWLAEYLAIALFVVLGIFLRQQDSAESKPVESRNQTTGEANKYTTRRQLKSLLSSVIVMSGAMRLNGKPPTYPTQTWCA